VGGEEKNVMDPKLTDNELHLDQRLPRKDSGRGGKPGPSAQEVLVREKAEKEATERGRPVNNQKTAETRYMKGNAGKEERKARLRYTEDVVL